MKQQRLRTVTNFIIDASGPQSLFCDLYNSRRELDTVDERTHTGATRGKEYGEWDEGGKQPDRTESEEERLEEESASRWV